AYITYASHQMSTGSMLFPYTTLFRSGKCHDQGDLSHLPKIRTNWRARLWLGGRGQAYVGVTPELEPLRETPNPRRRHTRSCGHRSEEHTSELQSHLKIVCRLLLDKKK